MKYRLLMTLTACLILFGCKKSGYRALDITNNAEYDIMVYHPLNSGPDSRNGWERKYYHYPDTTLSPMMPSNIHRVVRNELCHILYEVRYRKHFKDLKDTSSMFIFNADSLDYYGWDSVYTHNILIQRYDITAEMLYKYEGYDENHGDCIELLSFPPTKRMGEMIKMWPPYGTYDANGNRISSLSN